MFFHNNHLIECFYMNKKNVFEYEKGGGLVRIGMRDIQFKTIEWQAFDNGSNT